MYSSKESGTQRQRAVWQATGVGVSCNHIFREQHIRELYISVFASDESMVPGRATEFVVRVIVTEVRVRLERHDLLF